MFGIFTLAIKFHCLFLDILKSFYWFVTLIFDKLAPPLWIYVSKIALNHFLVHSSAKKNSLSRTKNVVFSLFCTLIDRPMGGLAPRPPPPHSLATLLQTTRLCDRILAWCLIPFGRKVLSSSKCDWLMRRRSAAFFLISQSHGVLLGLWEYVRPGSHNHVFCTICLHQYFWGYHILMLLPYSASEQTKASSFFR